MPDPRGAPLIAVPGLATRYRWDEAWAELPPPEDPGAWAHPGLAAGPDGRVLVVDADRPRVDVIAQDGSLEGTIALPVTEGHSLLMDTQDGAPVLWVADNGMKLRARGAEGLRLGPDGGRVIKVDLSGQVLEEIGAPPHPAYREQPFRPTGVVAWGPPGPGRLLFVADGYGAHLVHRYRADGTYLGSIAGGDDTDLRFRTPHAVLVDERGPEPRLLVTDRVGQRIQVFDLDGAHRGVIADGVLTSPSALAFLGDLLLVGELRASLAVLDPRDLLIGRVGDAVTVFEEPGWPNAFDAHGDLIRRPAFTPGLFHAPHGLAVDASGAIHVAEFVIGGRLVRLTPVP